MPHLRRLLLRWAAAQLVVASCLPAAAQPYLVKDINATGGSGLGSTPSFFTVLNGRVLFAPLGGELWSTDGTPEGTAVVRDIYPGSEGSAPIPAWWSVDDGPFYFLANGSLPPGYRPDLWRSDGTAPGTFQLTFGVDVYNLIGTVRDRRLTLFAAADPEHGTEPWVTDGTAEGTHLLADLAPGGPGESSDPFGGAQMNGELLFFAADGDQLGLWRTDGTAAGTALVADVPSGPPYGSPQRIVAFDHDLLFVDGDAAHGRELWISDGTAAGTHLLRDLTPGPADTTFVSYDIAVVGDAALFVASSGTGSALYRTDGTEAGTVPLVGFPAADPFPSSFQDFRVFDSILYFSVDDGVHGVELWKSDGSSAGTAMIRDICPGACSSGAAELFNSPIGVAFEASDGHHGEEPWVTDGTATGTRMVADLCPGSCSGGGFAFGGVPGAAILLGHPAEGGQQLWSTLGTPASTVRITDFANPCPFCNTGAYFITEPVGDVFVFDADDGIHGDEPWRTDGTPDGTYLLTDIYPDGSASADPQDLITAGDLLFFSADDGVHGRQLWRSDGSAAGTAQLAEIVPQSPQTGYAEFRALGSIDGIAYYSVDLSDLGKVQVWRSDGTAGGTVRLLEVNEEGYHFFTVAPRPGGAFIVGGVGLWTTDGTAAGTHHVKSLTASNSVVGNSALAEVDGELFFSAADDNSSDFELWKSDGTTQGTVRVKDILGNGGGSDPKDFAAVAGQVYFSADDGEHGRELWRSDGSGAGTELVADLAPGFYPSNPYDLFALGDKLFFFTAAGPPAPSLWVLESGGGAPTALAGAEVSTDLRSQPRLATLAGRLYFLNSDSDPPGLWVSDGTPGGTHAVAELLPAGRSAVKVWAAAGRLVLLAVQDMYVSDLWVSDGTPAGTHRIADLGEFYSQQAAFWEMGYLGSLALFPAADGGVGNELRAVDLATVLPPPPAGPVPPAVPTGLTAEALDSHQVLVTWQAGSSDETRFVVGLSSPAVPVPQPVAAVSAGTTAAVISGLNPGEPYTFRVRAENGYGESDWSAEASAMPLTDASGPCTPSAQALCLLGGRFRVQVYWRDQHNGGQGTGGAVPFPGSDKTGLFWFFNPNNIELIVKNLDGSSVNGYVWTFYGALSDVEYWIAVTDTQEHRDRVYHNPPGEICGRGDTGSFLELPSAAAPIAAGPSAGGVVGAELRPWSTPLAASGTAGACTPDAHTLCLLGGRFAVSVDWHDQHNGGDGVGTAIAGTDVSGYFWFFNPANVELVVKTLDATTVNGHFWVFYGALSDVEYTLRVTDTQTGAVKTYPNPAGNICGRGDTAAF
jgi:ELWxxDGT repeat protein